MLGHSGLGHVSASHGHRWVLEQPDGGLCHVLEAHLRKDGTGQLPRNQYAIDVEVVVEVRCATTLISSSSGQRTQSL